MNMTHNILFFKLFLENIFYNRYILNKKKVMRGSNSYILFCTCICIQPLDYSLRTRIDYISINILDLEQIEEVVGVVYLTILNTISSLG